MMADPPGLRPLFLKGLPGLPAGMGPLQGTGWSLGGHCLLAWPAAPLLTVAGRGGSRASMGWCEGGLVAKGRISAAPARL